MSPGAETRARSGRAEGSVVDLDATFLPTGRMRQIARVTDLADEVIVGQVDLAEAGWVFPHHFPGDPVFPGTLLVEAAGQLVAAWAWADGRRGRPRLVRSGARHRASIRPGDGRVILRGTVRRRGAMHFGDVSVRAGGQEAASVELALTVLPADE